MRLVQIKTIQTRCNTNLQRSFDSSPHYSRASCLSLLRTDTVLPAGAARSIGADRRAVATLHQLLNNHTDVVILCCDLDSAIADVDIRSAQSS